MNAIVLAVIVMIGLCLLRVNVVLALIIGAIIGGATSGLHIQETIELFTEGLGNSAEVALSYAVLGAFAVTIARTGLPEAVVSLALKLVGSREGNIEKNYSRVLILLVVLIMSCFSQNLIPIHVAFIPILIPPLLKVFNELKMDRRLVSAVITFGLITPYMWLPTGFGAIYHDILYTNMTSSGLSIEKSEIARAMTIPSLGMIFGLLIAAFISYKRPRDYGVSEPLAGGDSTISYSWRKVAFAFVAIIVALFVQLSFDSMIFGALAGIVTLYLTGSAPFREGDRLFSEGMKLMAFIGFVMLASSGFANVIKATGHIEQLVKASVQFVGESQLLGAMFMLLVGLLVTMGIGSSFSTIPIIAAIFVPLCMELGYSSMATIAIIGAAGALGDAGSPASDSTLGPTSGLNADGKHNHIWDTCIPTFLHFNIPLILFGLIAVMVL